jgi:hypothetical protein
MRVLVIGLCLFSASLFAAHPICVRHYAEKDGVNLCERFADIYAFVQPLKANMTKPVCTRIYQDFFCQQSKTYEVIPSLNKGPICILNENQPPVSNFCESVPDFYEYVQGGLED